MQKLNKTDLKNIIDGAVFLGSGGGGTQQLVDQFFSILPDDIIIELINPGEIDLSKAAFIPSIVGYEKSQGQRLDSKLLFLKHSLKNANLPGGGISDLLKKMILDLFNYFSNELKKEGLNNNKEIKYVFPIEIGSMNILYAFLMIYFIDNSFQLIDCDGAGRSIPQLNLTVLADRASSSISPLAFSDFPKSSEEIIINDEDPKEMDETLRNELNKLDTNVGLTCGWYFNNKDKIIDATITNTITKAKEIGEILKVQDDNTIVNLMNYLNTKFIAPGNYNNAYLLLEDGSVDRKDSYEDGFDLSKIKIIGKDNRELIIYSKNENLLTWDPVNKKTLAMAPDSICFVNDMGNSLHYSELSKLESSDKVNVIGIRAFNKMRSDHIENIFLYNINETINKLGRGQDMPSYEKYIPIEELNN